MKELVFAAIAALNEAKSLIDKAELAQSTMDPLWGPGTREWEIIRERIAAVEGDIRLAIDEPGTLERWEDG